MGQVAVNAVITRSLVVGRWHGTALSSSTSTVEAEEPLQRNHRVWSDPPTQELG